MSIPRTGRSHRRAGLAWTLPVVFGWVASIAQAQTAAPNRPPPVAPKQLQAVALAGPVVVDGVLDEPAWQREGGTQFRKRSPSGRGGPSEKTEVWVAFDERALYLAVRCYDSDPSRINRKIGPRDSNIESDWITVALDPYHDRRTGFFFAVNPGGSVQDGILYDDVRSDRSWNGVWDRGTSVDSIGWAAEIRIPFNQLRFDAGKEQVWGINFTRRIHRANEVVDFTPSPRGRQGNVSLFAELVGLDRLRSPVRLEVLPYVVAEAHDYQGQTDNPFYTGRDYGTNVGADLKLGIGSSVTLDAALNPDFGQVEVDPAVVNLTANETFYPERRPFFLEGAGIFDFGRGAGMRFFHSRRIGRVPQGSTDREGHVDTPSQTRILGAAKLSGKVADSWTVGWLNAVTAREFAQVDVQGTRHFDEIEPLSYYGVFRAQRGFDEGNRGIGVFSSAAVRDLGEQRLERILNGDAWVGGIDGWSRFGRSGRTAIEGWAGFTRISGSPAQMIRQQGSSRRYFQRPDATHLRVDSSSTALTGAAGQLLFRTRAGRFGGVATLRAITPGFELNDLGYNNRSDLASADVSIRYYLSSGDDHFDRSTVGISASREYDFGQTLLGASYSAFASTELKNLWGGSASVSYSPEGLDVRNTRGGPSMLSPAGWSGSLSIHSDSRKLVLLSASGQMSRDAAGSWTAGAGGDLSWYPSPGIALSVGPWWGRYFADAGYFTRRRDPTAAHTYGYRSVFAGLTQEYFSTDLRLDWTFTPGLSLQLYAQPYFTDIRYQRFKELARAGTYDFLVYGEQGSSLEYVPEEGAYVIDPDDAGPARPFTLYNSDFDYASLRGTGVLRWEYRPGSSVVFAWTHDRYAYDDFWQHWRSNLLESPPDNRFMVKMTYWFSP